MGQSYTPNPYFGMRNDDFNTVESFSFVKTKAKRGRGRKLPSNVRLDSSLHDSIVSELLSLLSCDESFAAKYLAEVLLSKYVGPDTDDAATRAQRAVDKWLATELRNRKTNWRLIEFDPISNDLDLGWTTMSALVKTIRRTIRRVLGTSFPEEALYGSFSGGASTSKGKMPGAVYRKFATQADVTSEAYADARRIVSTCETWLAYRQHGKFDELRVVEGNIMFTVPKSSTIDRVAAKEPDFNCFAQKGVGDFIRRRLKSVEGIDLNDQSINRSLAKKGSVRGELATIDLSSASDSVCTQLVYLLLPPEWAVQLDCLRSQRTQLPDGTMHYNEMFSSMGNGFTFELESLIFLAIAKAVRYHSGNPAGRISVYGDDIVVPACIAARFARVLHWFGFLVNNEKSFWKGRFRESCGGHYYRGEDVTPFYIKEPIDTTERLIHFLNRLRKWSAAGSREGYHALWVKYSQYVGTHLHGGWNVESPVALVTYRSAARQYYRLARVSVPFPNSRKGGKVELLEQDAVQLGGYLFALRSLDGRSGVFRLIDVGDVAGEVFFEDPFDPLYSPPKEYVGWKVIRNDRPSWESGQIPEFPEEYWCP